MILAGDTYERSSPTSLATWGIVAQPGRQSTLLSSSCQRSKGVPTRSFRLWPVPSAISSDRFMARTILAGRSSWARPPSLT